LVAFYVYISGYLTFKSRLLPTLRAPSKPKFNLQGCAAVQVATGLLVMRRCLIRNSAIGLEIGDS